MRKPFQASELFETMTKHLGVCYTYAESNHQEESEKFLLNQLDSKALSVLSDDLFRTYARIISREGFLSC